MCFHKHSWLQCLILWSFSQLIGICTGEEHQGVCKFKHNWNISHSFTEKYLQYFLTWERNNETCIRVCVCVYGQILFQTFALYTEIVHSSSIEKGQEWNKTPKGLKLDWPKISSKQFSIGKCQIIKNEVICENQSTLTKSQGGRFPASLPVKLPSPLSFGCQINDAHPPEQLDRRPGSCCCLCLESSPALEAARSFRTIKSSVTLTFLLNCMTDVIFWRDIRMCVLFFPFSNVFF